MLDVLVQRLKFQKFAGLVDIAIDQDVAFIHQLNEARLRFRQRDRLRKLARRGLLELGHQIPAPVNPGNLFGFL